MPHRNVLIIEIVIFLIGCLGLLMIINGNFSSVWLVLALGIPFSIFSTLIEIVKKKSKKVVE